MAKDAETVTRGTDEPELPDIIYADEHAFTLARKLQAIGEVVVTIGQTLEEGMRDLPKGKHTPFDESELGVHSTLSAAVVDALTAYLCDTRRNAHLVCTDLEASNDVARIVSLVSKNIELRSMGAGR